MGAFRPQYIVSYAGTSTRSLDLAERGVSSKVLLCLGAVLNYSLAARSCLQIALRMVLLKLPP